MIGMYKEMDRVIEKEKGEFLFEIWNSPFFLLPIMRRYINLICIEYTVNQKGKFCIFLLFLISELFVFLSI